MFVDACAIIAMFSSEPEAAAYARAIDAADRPWTSALAAFEAVLVLSRPDKLDLAYRPTLDLVLAYIKRSGVALGEMGPPEEILRNAAWAADRHGVSRKKLSVFDCLHYASAKSAGQPLLTLDKLLRDTDIPTLP